MGSEPRKILDIIAFRSPTTGWGASRDGAPGTSRAAIEHLLADFEDALQAYERTSAHALGDVDEQGAPRSAWAVRRGKNPVDAAGCESVLFAFSAEDADALGASLIALGRDEGGPEKPTRLYALCVTDAIDSAESEQALRCIGTKCAAAGFIWCGGLAFGGSAAIERDAGKPRMGIFRRRRSWAIDRLIAAVRAEAPLNSLPQLEGRNVLAVRGRR